MQAVKALFRTLPHILTLSNLFAGCCACLFLILPNHQHLVLWCFVASGIADFLDGFAARAAGVSGDFGKELDSLADMVSFGVVPGLMAFTMLNNETLASPPVYTYIAFLIPVFAAVRLARFNTSQSDTKHFIGLAVPSSTFFWLGLYMTWLNDNLDLQEQLSNPTILIPLIIIFSLLQISNLPLFSNKLNPLAPKNWAVWVVLTSLILSTFIWGWIGISLGMTLYVLSGLVWRPDN